MVNHHNFLLCCCVLFSVLAPSFGSPKKYNPDDGSYQSNNRYYESNLPSSVNTTKYESKESKETSSDRLRFGIPISNYGNTGSGVQYGGGNVGYMVSPLKIDIGGIALGAIIGLGAILVIPKLASAFGGGYGYRSLENDMSSVTDILSRIDNSLEQHNIDSSSCMQRIICSYVNEAEKNMENGEANTLDQFVLSLSNNTLFSYMLDGTAIKQAVEMGKQGDIEKCASLYSKCPISRENVVKVVASLLPV